MCLGDSGGPIVIPDKEDNFPYIGCSQHDRILGFISKGDHCDKINGLGGYIRLSHFRDWIEDTMEVGIMCKLQSTLKNSKCIVFLKRTRSLLTIHSESKNQK